jgi:hypothetical protein
VDTMFVLRQHRWLEGASFKQLRTLAGVARDVPLEVGRPLVARGDAPAIYQVLQGDVLIESDAGGVVRVGAGGTFGLVETLADVPWACEAVAGSAGRALRLDRDDVWAALSDVGLLETLLCGVLSLRSDIPAATV